RGICAYDNRMPDNTFVAGRHIMTCCIDDVEYSPIVCICKGKHSIKSRDWIMVTGTIKIEYCKFYQGKGPVIHIEETAITSAPEQELATFY
ncbi:MAG: GTPase, partial [Clostridia bacterium]|nr:GTPase [Clostridia bacterium]